MDQNQCSVGSSITIPHIRGQHRRHRSVSHSPRGAGEWKHHPGLIQCAAEHRWNSFVFQHHTRNIHRRRTRRDEFPGKNIRPGSHYSRRDLLPRTPDNQPLYVRDCVIRVGKLEELRLKPPDSIRSALINLCSSIALSTRENSSNLCCLGCSGHLGTPCSSDCAASAAKGVVVTTQFALPTARTSTVNPTHSRCQKGRNSGLGSASTDHTTHIRKPIRTLRVRRPATGYIRVHSPKPPRSLRIIASN